VSCIKGITYCKLAVFEKRMLRIMRGLKRMEVTGRWKELHNRELHNLYYLPNILL
jgi:hypothetical protein